MYSKRCSLLLQLLRDLSCVCLTTVSPAETADDDDDDDDDETWIYIAHRHKISNALNRSVSRLGLREARNHVLDGDTSSKSSPPAPDRRLS